MDEIRDLNDGKEWSEMDIADLRAFTKAGASIQETASFLCRSTNVAEVEAKARELGLPVRNE